MMNAASVAWSQPCRRAIDAGNWYNNADMKCHPLTEFVERDSLAADNCQSQSVNVCYQRKYCNEHQSKDFFWRRVCSHRGVLLLGSVATISYNLYEACSAQWHAEQDCPYRQNFVRGTFHSEYRTTSDCSFEIRQLWQYHRRLLASAPFP
jgi:hypothetical protein